MLLEPFHGLDERIHLKNWDKEEKVSKEDIAKAESLFKEHGWWSVKPAAHIQVNPFPFPANPYGRSKKPMYSAANHMLHAVYNNLVLVSYQRQC